MQKVTSNIEDRENIINIVRSKSIERSCEEDYKWAFSHLKPKQTQYLTHGYHRYPAKFIPQLVSVLIQEYSRPKEIICDPFGGCGTTLVEAKLAGRQSLGFDINPLAVLITRVKTTAIPPSKLADRYALLCKEMEAGRSAQRKGVTNNFEHYDRLSYWFGKDNLEQVLILRNRIRSESDTSVGRFFMCGLSHVLKKCSYWLSSSIKPQKDPTKIPNHPIEAFRHHIDHMIIRNEEYYQTLKGKRCLSTKSIMRRADARHLPLKNGSVDLIITSPPYSISYDYLDIHQLSICVLGYCHLLSELKTSFIGSKNSNDCSQLTTNRKARQTIDSLASLDRRLFKAINNYFEDMHLAYSEFHRVLKGQGRACIVLGDTVARGITIPNVEVALEQLEEAGFIVEQIVERPVSGKVLDPYRDSTTGQFTSAANPTATKMYSHEYILIVKKTRSLYC